MPDKTDHQVETLALRVIRTAQNTLLMHLRFMDTAIFRLTPKQAETTLATDGLELYYDARYVLRRFRQDPKQFVRDMLHTVMHCVFHHPFVGAAIDVEIWDLAADVAVENVILSLGVSCANTKRDRMQKTVLAELQTHIKRMNAESIYRYYRELDLTGDVLARLRALFYSDDHGVWYQLMPNAADSQGEDGDEKDNGSDAEEDSEQDDSAEADRDGDQGDPADENEGGNQGFWANAEGIDGQDGEEGAAEGSSSQNGEERAGGGSVSDSPCFSIDRPAPDIAKEWAYVSQQIRTDLETFSREWGDTAGCMLQQLRELHREKYDYGAFLRRLAVMGEAMKINDDEFDFIFYTYGLKLYGSVPLIEPLEYKEEKRIRDFVIAIDTSGSTVPFVQRFLTKTYNILKSAESYFSKINLHIIQCDAAIHEHVKITTQEAFDEYIKGVTIKGFGGTDFRPVFKEVDRMIENKELQRLKGLIYLSDGYGDFPARKPDYETAFIFLRDDYYDPPVPPWVIKLLLDDEDV